MVEREATVQNHHGIHCRPAAEIVKAVRNYPGTVAVRTERGSCDLHSTFGLLSLGLSQGSRVRIRVTGEAAGDLCETVVLLFEKRFNFPGSRGGS